MLTLISLDQFYRIHSIKAAMVSNSLYLV